MTVSLDARTPSATVHALSNSTPPGGGATMQPFGVATAAAAVAELPDTFAPPGAGAADVVAGLAACRATEGHPDAEVIDLAGRVEALAARENKASGWVGTIEDHITFKGPRHPMRRDESPGASERNRECSSAELLALLASGLRDETTPEWLSDIGERINRMRIYEAAVQAMKDRLDLVRVDKRCRRMFRRLVRWAARLTAMEPVTQVGLKAKAEAQLAVDRAGNFDNWTAELASSVGRDAVRIIAAEAEVRWREAQDADGELLSLIARHAPAMKAWDDADEAQAPFSEAWSAACPSRPHALRSRLTDRPFHASGREPIESSTSWFPIYTEKDVEALRGRAEPTRAVEHRSPAPWNANETVVRVERLPDDRLIARRVEILTAWDAWQAEKERLREATGLNAANAVVDAAAERTNAIEDTILDYQPRTFEGLQAKARWIAAGFVPEQRAVSLLRDLCRMPPVAMAPPAQVTPSRHVVETYRTFLLFELRYLDHEVYGDPDGKRMGYLMDNPAASFHHDAPPPSTRAAAVLSTLGLMPCSSAMEKRETEARAA